MEEELELGNDDFQDLVEIKIDPGQSALRIDKFLTDRLDRVSRNRIQQAIAVGAVMVNQKSIKSNYKIRPNDFISILIPRPPESSREIIPENIPLDIVYEDDDLLIVNKPPGLVVHPGVGNHRGTLVNALKYYLGANEEKVGLVHRIDKDTSGLLVVAKNEISMSHLAKQFFYHTIERTYFALCWGEPNPLKCTIIGNIGRHPRFRKQFTVFPDGDQGKEAITHYEVIEPLYFVSLVKCNLETGRTHQIRVHLKYLGHPLFNDERYGGDRILKGTIFTKYKQFVNNVSDILPRQALHAASLGFIHPTTGKKMYFEQELPPDFKNALDKWRNYVNYQKSKIDNDLSSD
ncbi:MAG: hypothetical protein RJA52_464 [Bacteroidota bacterium]|jgi:23S rRNA pseudouridine1911/1915/1917 synthase